MPLERDERRPGVAVITGASSGIGRATATRLAADGWFVVAAAIDGPATPERSSRSLRARLDVRDAASVAALFERVDALGEPLQLLVNCAGVGLYRALLDTDDAAWEEVLAVNLTGSFRTCKAAAQRMSGRGGRIVNIGSIADHRVLPNNGAYGASKFGVRALSGTLAEELKHARVRVTLVSPGAVATPLWGDDPVFPTSDMLQPEDIAGVIATVAALPLHVRLDEIHVAPEKGVL